MRKIGLVTLIAIFSSMASANAVVCQGTNGEEGYAVIQPSLQDFISSEGYACEKSIDLLYKIEDATGLSALELMAEDKAVRNAFLDLQAIGEAAGALCRINSKYMFNTRKSISLYYKFVCYANDPKALDAIQFLPLIRSAKDILRFSLEPEYPAFPVGVVIFN